MNNIVNGLSEFERISIQQSNRDFWVSLIVVIITLISAILVYIDYRNRKNKERAEKSINIAEEFAQSIIPKLSLIYTLFKDSELEKIISRVKFTRFIDFDTEEMHELYSEKDIDKYKTLLSSNKDLQVDSQEIDTKDFIVLVLNELEHMCMYISTKVADEKYIYNSLHQQFFKSISLLYMSISIINVDNKDKYYTNIIYVYNLWVNKYIKSEKKEEKLKLKQDKLKNKEKKLKQKSKPNIPKVK